MLIQIYFWFIIFALCCNFAIALERHDKPKTGKYHFMEGVVGLILWLPALIVLFKNIF